MILRAYILTMLCHAATSPRTGAGGIHRGGSIEQTGDWRCVLRATPMHVHSHAIYTPYTHTLYIHPTLTRYIYTLHSYTIYTPTRIHSHTIYTPHTYYTHHTHTLYTHHTHTIYTTHTHYIHTTLTHYTHHTHTGNWRCGLEVWLSLRRRRPNRGVPTARCDIASGFAECGAHDLYARQC
jgi:hypothetical protein